MIPRIVHQTWKSAEIPSAWQLAHHSWRSNHPDWEYRLWTDEDNRNHVAAHYPELLDWYESLPYAILKADVARVLILDCYGGVYADLDTECLRPLGPLLQNAAMVAGLEPRRHARWLGRRRMVSNAVFAATPRHPFLRRVIAAFEAFPREIWTHRDVLEQTGPLLFSRIHSDYRGSDLMLVEPVVFSPLNAGDPRLATLQFRKEGFETVRADCVSRGAFVVHYWANSWMGTLAGELFNPEPHAVPGFRFYPGMDSSGADIKNGGRDIPKLASECLENQTAVGFNTDGFLKSHIQPRSAWQRMSGPQETSGLYVKEGVVIPDEADENRIVRAWRQSRQMLRAAWGRRR